MNIDKQLDGILESMGESYYPLHEYPDSYELDNIATRNTSAMEIKQLIRDVLAEVTPERRSHKSREYQNWPDIVNGHDEAIKEMEEKAAALGFTGLNRSRPEDLS
jgi:hypothetical protein